MSNFISDLVSGGAEGLLKGAGEFAKDLRQAFTGEISPEKKADLIQRAQEIEFASEKIQGDINLAEAQNTSIFVSGWRPFIGWVCGASLAVYYIPRFVLGTALWTMQSWQANQLLPMPEMGIGDIIGLVTALLGMSSLRMIEKVKGVANK